jgi:acetyl esterase/lipase
MCSTRNARSTNTRISTVRFHLSSLAIRRKTEWGWLWLFTACVAVAALLSGNAVADAPKPEKSEKTIALPEGVAYIPDVTYCQFDDQTTLETDFALPSRGVGPFPTVVFLHGGGWVLGDRKNMTPYLITAAKAGYVAVAVSYRLAPAHPFPAQVQDSKCAVRWLRANASQYKIDKERIAAFGFSAGGNLACMLGATDGKEFKVCGGNADQSDRVQAVVSFYGMLDLSEFDRCRKDMAARQSCMISYSLTNYLGGTREKFEERYVKASPGTHVTKGTAPTFLVHGTEDKLVPFAQSRSYEVKLKESGVDVSLLPVEGEDHNFVGEAEQKAFKAVFQFLDKRLKRDDTAAVVPTKK